MKGSEAGGRGAFSTGDGPGSAEAWRRPGPRRPRQPCPGLGGRAGGKEGCGVRGPGGRERVPPGSKRGERSGRRFPRKHDLRGKLQRLPGDSALSLFPALVAPSGVPSTRFPAAAGTRGAAFREVAPRSQKTPNPVVVDSPV